jgi:hypothetical protein
MLSREGLPDELWGEAVNYANYIRERVLKRTPDGVSMSPYERRTDNSPDLHRMKIFGCKAISHVPRKKRGKLDDRARFGIFVRIEGYDTYRIYYPETREVEIVRNARFDETAFPGEEAESSSDVGCDDSDDDYSDLPSLADTESESEYELAESTDESEDDEEEYKSLDDGGDDESEEEPEAEDE